MSYTRNFEFRVPPHGGQRGGRFYTPDAAVIGLPITLDADGDENELGLAPVKVVTAAGAPVRGASGILVYEFKGAEGFAGDDPFLVTYSDKDTAPAGAAVQMVFGEEVKVAFRNTVDSRFLQTRNYTGRTMVAGLGATPTVAVGDFLTPRDGADGNGYWAETATAANAWLVVTKVDPDRGEVEARFAF